MNGFIGLTDAGVWARIALAIFFPPPINDHWRTKAKQETAGTVLYFRNFDVPTFPHDASTSDKAAPM